MSEREQGNAAAVELSCPVLCDPAGKDPIRAELYGTDSLESHARQLAAHSAAAVIRPGWPLLGQFLENSRALVRAHQRIKEAYGRGETMASDAEWLLDNFYIIADVLAEVHVDLPRGYYKLLPKLTTGPLADLPRVYALALEFVAHCDSSLDETHLTGFVVRMARPDR
jgi:cyclic beta-1,2-glucan synthetase